MRYGHTLQQSNQTAMVFRSGTYISTHEALIRIPQLTAEATMSRLVVMTTD